MMEAESKGKLKDQDIFLVTGDSESKGENREDNVTRIYSRSVSKIECHNDH
jgi:hypothetical protein